LHDADEVGEESINDSGDVEGEDNLLLSGLGGESNSVVSGSHEWHLVPGEEIEGVPAGEQGDGDDGHDAGGSESGPGVIRVLGEESNGEHARDDKGDREQDTDEDVPPHNIVIKELIKDLEELGEGKSNDEASNAVDSALDGEEAAA